MKGFYTKQHVFVVYQSVLIIFIMLLGLLAAGFPRLSLINSMLFGTTLFISLLGITYGLFISLGVCLAILLSLCVVLFWDALDSTTPFLSTTETVCWTLAFLVSALITGAFHKWMMSIIAENKEINIKFEELVIIDEETGLDNGKRFLFELEGEFKRSQRTGLSFSLLLIKLMYFGQYQRVYGYKESQDLLSVVANVLCEQTGIHDRKFRFKEDTFAIILPNTLEEEMGSVMNKIETPLQQHISENNKTLTISFGSASYSEDISDYMQLFEHAQYKLDQCSIDASKL